MANICFQLGEAKHLLKRSEILLNVGRAGVLELIHPFLEQTPEEVYDGQLFVPMELTQSLIHKVGEVSTVPDLFAYICFKTSSSLSGIQHQGKGQQILFQDFGTQ